MKKVVALALVLGLVSFASAAFEPGDLQVVPTGAASFDVVAASGLDNGKNLSGGFFAVVGVEAAVDGLNAGDLGDLGAIYGDAGDSGYFPAGSGQYGAYSNSASTWAVPAGTVLAAGTVAGPTMVQVWGIADDFSSTVLLGEATVPEPITMSLLGLGALALRRRRA